jgi:hypothetical protein
MVVSLELSTPRKPTGYINDPAISNDKIAITRNVKNILANSSLHRKYCSDCDKRICEEDDRKNFEVTSP